MALKAVLLNCTLKKHPIPPEGNTVPCKHGG